MIGHLSRVRMVCLKDLRIRNLKVWNVFLINPLNGIKKYEQLRETPTMKTLKAVKESLMTSTRVVKAMRDKIESQLAIDEEDNVDSMLNNINRLMKLSEQLPNTIDTIKNLEEKVKTDELQRGKIKGGGEIGLFEN